MSSYCWYYKVGCITNVIVLLGFVVFSIRKEMIFMYVHHFIAWGFGNTFFHEIVWCGDFVWRILWSWNCQVCFHLFVYMVLVGSLVWWNLGLKMWDVFFILRWYLKDLFLVRVITFMYFCSCIKCEYVLSMKFETRVDHIELL